LQEALVSELKRNINFQRDSGKPPAASVARGAADSQSLPAGNSQRILNPWTNASDAGCDPYNSTGIRAFRRHTS
jgi:hypothetical protein